MYSLLNTNQSKLDRIFCLSDIKITEALSSENYINYLFIYLFDFNEYIISRTMMKHLLIMGIFQWIVIFVIIFAGEYFIPEDNTYFPNTDGKFVYPGRAYDWKGNKLYLYYSDDKDLGPSRHFTIVFNVFVFMQIFNMICARKIDDELNIFEGIHHNSMFIIIIISITIVQVILVQFTQDVFQCARKGLIWSQWLFWIGVALCVFPLNFITKFIPTKIIPDFGKKKKKFEVQPTKDKNLHQNEGSNGQNTPQEEV